MPALTSALSMEESHSCSHLPSKIAHVEVLSNEVLVRIFEQASNGNGHHTMRAVLPLVCKRWRDAVNGAKGDVKHMGTGLSHFPFPLKNRITSLMRSLSLQAVWYTAIL